MSQITMTPADAMITLETSINGTDSFMSEDINLKVKQGRTHRTLRPFRFQGNQRPFAVLTILRNISRVALWLMVLS